MEGFLETVFSFPTLPLTVLLGIVLCYWAFALVTGVTFGHAEGAGDAVAGGVKAAGDAVAGGIKAAGDAVAGGVKAAGDAAGGALKGAGDAVAQGISGSGESLGSAADSVGDGAGSAHEGGFFEALLGLGRIPVTVTASLVVLAAWTLSALGVNLIHPAGILARVGLLLASLVAGLLVTALILRPVGTALTSAKPARQRDVLGHVCTLTSGRVDAAFGTATVDDGGAGLNVHVVCRKPNALKKGDKALLVEFDPSKETYEIEPIDWLLPEETEALKDPLRAHSVIASRIRRR